MEQQQFKVSFSLGTKLLLSIVLLLIVVIAFLNISTIFLLTDDKRAYVYQSQSTEAVLAGREFANTVRHSFDTLRLSMAAVDPRQAPGPKQVSALKGVIDNQSDILFSSVSLIDLTTGKLTPHTQTSREQGMKDEKVIESDFSLTPEVITPVLADLKKDSYALVNMTKTGAAPMVGILLVDTKLKDNPAGVPLGLGVVSLREYSSGLKGLNLSLVSSLGRVLYDADLAQVYSRAILSTIADADPLPFVPPMCTASKLASGAPCRAHACLIASRPSRIPSGTRA